MSVSELHLALERKRYRTAQSYEMDALEDLESTTILLEPIHPVSNGKILRMKLPRFVDVISYFIKSNCADLVTEGTSSMDYHESIRVRNICEREQQTDDITDRYKPAKHSKSTQTCDTVKNLVKPLTSCPSQRTATVAPFGASWSCNKDDSLKERLDCERNDPGRKATRILSHHLERLKNLIRIISRYRASEMNTFTMTYIEDVSQLASDMVENNADQQRIAEEFERKMAKLESENSRVWAGGSNTSSRVPRDALYTVTRTIHNPPPKPQKWRASSRHRPGTSRTERIDMTDRKCHDRHESSISSSTTESSPLKRQTDRSRSPILKREKPGNPQLRSDNTPAANTRLARLHLGAVTGKRQRNNSDHYNIRRRGDSKKEASKSTNHLPTHAGANTKTSWHNHCNDVGPVDSVHSSTPMEHNFTNTGWHLFAMSECHQHDIGNAEINGTVMIDKTVSNHVKNTYRPDGNSTNPHQAYEDTLSAKEGSRARDDMENIMANMVAVEEAVQRDVKPWVNPKSPVLQTPACRKYRGIQRNKPPEQATSSGYPQRTLIRRVVTREDDQSANHKREYHSKAVRSTAEHGRKKIDRHRDGRTHSYGVHSRFDQSKV